MVMDRLQMQPDYSMGAKRRYRSYFTNYEECINLENLVAAFYEEMKVKSGTDNYSRDLRMLLVRWGLMLLEVCLICR